MDPTRGPGRAERDALREGGDGLTSGTSLAERGEQPRLRWLASGAGGSGRGGASTRCGRGSGPRGGERCAGARAERERSWAARREWLGR